MKFRKTAVKESFMSVRESLKTVRSRNGAYSAAAIVIVVIIAVVLNLICSRLPASVKQIDISDNNLYEISDTSKAMLKELENDVTITVVAETDSVDDRLMTFLEKYAAVSKHITLDTVDPVLHPSALTEYETESDTVIVSCEDTGLSSQISISEILVQDMYSYYYGSGDITSFDGDGQITAAISQVCGSEEKKAYYLTDHGEVELSSTITSLMSKSGIELESLSLLMKNEIPEDCDMILVNGLASDMTEDETGLLSNYIKEGGNVTILLSQDSPESGNVVDFMNDFGIEQQDGYVADMERNYQQNYYYIFPNIAAPEELTENMKTGMVLMGNSRGFKTAESSSEISVESLLETSAYGYMVTEDSETQGTFTTAARAVYTAASEEDDEEASESGVISGTLTVYGSDSIIDENLTSAFSGLDNNTLFMNTVTDSIGDVTNLAIEAKSLEVQYNTPQYGGAVSIMIIFIIPIGVVIIGFVIWMRRRKA